MSIAPINADTFIPTPQRKWRSLESQQIPKCQGDNEGWQDAIAARLAKTLAAMCVRHTGIEKIHAGVDPISKTGDYSDVKVIDANGREIAWNDVSRISDDEIKGLMKQVINRLYTFFIQGEDPRFQKQADYFERISRSWDAPEPEIDSHLDCSKQSSDSSN